MTRMRAVLAAVACLSLCAAAPAAASTKFQPRIGGALGIMPPYGGGGQFGSQDIASGALIPVVYHGGNVMAGGVTVHTIFWAPKGYAFSGSPGAGIPSYTGMIEQFFTDVAADSGKTSNVFSVLPQYAEGQTPGHITPGSYSIKYSASADAITDTDPYPAKADQCASPQNTATCITDAQVQAEVDKVITANKGSRGMHDLWYVFTPPDVDECILPGECETNAYGGYHSLSNLGHGVAIYAYTGDPIVESSSVFNQGQDPEGNPDAEIVVDIAAHETNEAMTDPEGVGYMDPNGYEIGDKCEFGPQYGTPLGYAANGSPYNQVINGHEYLIQEMWANHANDNNYDCVQSTTNTTNDLPLPQVYLSQFSSGVSGNIERNTAGVGVTVSLIRQGPTQPLTVAQATATTASDGSWSVSLKGHAVGDDRDVITVQYSGTGAPTPNTQTILTGNGGNPFTESGWTGWTALDDGTALTPNSLTMAPCFQTGVLQAYINGTPVGGDPNALNSPTDYCSTQTDAATVPLTKAVGPGDVVTASSLDNRAFQNPNLPNANTVGGLVSLTVPVGEPNAVSLIASPLATFAPTGFPTCTADLEFQLVTCTGLVAGQTYTLTDGSQTASGSADPTGTLSEAMTIAKGDQIALSNGSRTVTTLHVAHLQAALTGSQDTVTSGTCDPGSYVAPPLATPPTNASAGVPTADAGGAALTDVACPLTGSLAGFSSSTLSETDEFSGGSTQTEVPDLEDTSPMQGETVYGAFTALAETGLPGPGGTTMPTDSTSSVAVSIAPASGGSVVFSSSKVNTTSGVAVAALKPGSYLATWTLTDANGDTRTVTTRFVEEASGQGAQGPQGPQGPRGPRGPRGKKGPKPHVKCSLVTRNGHLAIKCKVTYGKKHHKKGTLQLRLTRGHRVLALGHAAFKGGSATVWMRPLGRVTLGSLTATVVVRQPRTRPSTAAGVRVS